MGQVTRMLEAAGHGDAAAEQRLLTLLYEELRRLASQKLAGEAAGHTMTASDLVQEAYLRLLGPNQPNWQSRGHFFAATAEAMRRVLVDRARRRNARKRGGDWHRISLDDVELTVNTSPADLLAFDEALQRLERLDSQKAQVVNLRCFAGLEHGQIAEAMNLSSRTVKRHWRFARAWLMRDMGGPDTLDR